MDCYLAWYSGKIRQAVTASPAEACTEEWPYYDRQGVEGSRRGGPAGGEQSRAKGIMYDLNKRVSSCGTMCT